MRNEKLKYLLQNLLKGLLWLAIIVAIFLLLKDKINLNENPVFVKIFDSTFLVFTTFLISEVAFGIIPPEVFFIWALQFEQLNTYIVIILMLSLISFLAGMTGYLFGLFLKETRVFRYLRFKYLKKYNERLHQFGMYLVAVAALTPLPFSGICMLVGSVKYPFKRFLLWATLRFARFIAYGWIIWEANIL